MKGNHYIKNDSTFTPTVFKEVFSDDSEDTEDIENETDLEKIYLDILEKHSTKSRSELHEILIDQGLDLIAALLQIS